MVGEGAHPAEDGVAVKAIVADGVFCSRQRPEADDWVSKEICSLSRVTKG